MAFHVLNRSVARLTLFEKPEDYQAFYGILWEAWQEIPIRILDRQVDRLTCSSSPCDMPTPRTGRTGRTLLPTLLLVLNLGVSQLDTEDFQ